MDRNQKISEILRGYEKKRHFRELKCATDFERAMEFPEFRELQSEYAAAATSAEDAAAVRAAAVREKQTALLKKLKIDNFFETRRDCKRCGDTGYENGALCTCVKKRLCEKLRESSNIPSLPDFSSCDLSIFDGDARAQTAKVYAAMEKFAAAFPSEKYFNIFVTGGTGSGKTFLTLCLYSAILKRGFFAEYVSAFNLNNIFLKSHLARAEEKYGVLESLFDADMLVIDDLGAEPIYNNVTREYLFNVLNERAAAAKCTVVSSNLSPAEILARYGERIFSRISNKNTTVMISLPNKDLRLKI
ncbi:MAG: ATP-binding protein [Clostridiales bacterium]|jgi:DNA replication protein DnaC|nr:ATP-binding protein [Clostridiales bacterium]